MSTLWFSFLVLLAVHSSGCKRASSSKDSMSVFVAASLVDVADSLSLLFLSSHPDKRIRFNVGASSMLARQIEFGAPADYFLSADSVWSAYVVSKIPASTSSRVPATNKLVVFSSKRNFGSMRDLLTTTRLAIADPSHVPAGRYAKSVLECLELWDDLSSRIIPMSDVRAALAAATTESVDAAIVYATDAAIIQRIDRFVLPVPIACQPTISIDLVALPGSRQEGWREEFGRLLLSPLNAGAWESFGFQPIGGSN